MTKTLLPCPKIVRGQEALTPEQSEYARLFAQERIAAMLSPAAIDEAEAEKHLADAYRVAGLEPVPVRWFDSPISFVLAHLDGELDSVWDIVVTRVRASVPARLWAGVWDGVRANVQDGVRANVQANVGDSVRDSVRDSVPDDMWASVRASVVAYYDESWHSFYRFLHEVFEENNLIHLARFNEMVSGYHLGSKEAWLVRKPVLLSRDEQGRLHNASGPCMQYRDGWGFYAWHGVRCSEQLILHPETLTRQEWMNEPNVEVRRAIQERLGPQRFIDLVGGMTLDRGKRGTLIEIDLPDDPERVARYVQVQDSSTQRQYYLRVPPSITNADEAIAWTFGLDARDYQPGQET